MRDWLERNGYPSAQTGLKRSKLVGQNLQDVMRGYSLGPLTFSLYYATDLADQIENVIVPALRADFVVLADRYIYTPIARVTPSPSPHSPIPSLFTPLNSPPHTHTPLLGW